MRPTTPLTIIGSIYPEDPSNNTSLAAPSNPSDLLLTFSNRLSHQCFSCFISYASILNSLYLSISWYFMVFKRGTEQKKLSPSDHRILKDIQIIGVKKEKMTEHADWTQRDRNSSKRVKQKWLFAESKYIPGQSRTALTHRTRLDVWAGNRGCARRSYLHCLFRIKCRWIKMILGKKKKRKHAGNQPLFKSSISMVMFTSVMQQDGDSRDCFILQWSLSVVWDNVCH